MGSINGRYFFPRLTFSPVIKSGNETVSFCNSRAYCYWEERQPATLLGGQEWSPGRVSLARAVEWNASSGTWWPSQTVLSGAPGSRRAKLTYLGVRGVLVKPREAIWRIKQPPFHLRRPSGQAASGKTQESSLDLRGCWGCPWCPPSGSPTQLFLCVPAATLGWEVGGGAFLSGIPWTLPKGTVWISEALNRIGQLVTFLLSNQWVRRAQGEDQQSFRQNKLITPSLHSLATVWINSVILLQKSRTCLLYSLALTVPTPWPANRTVWALAPAQSLTVRTGWVSLPGAPGVPGS